MLDTLVLKDSEILTPLLSRFAFLANFFRIGILQGSEILTLIFMQKKTAVKFDILNTLVLKDAEILTPLLSRFAFLVKFCRIGILHGSEILTLIFIRKKQL